MFQFTAFAPVAGYRPCRWVAPFRQLWIAPCQPVPITFRRLPRLSSPSEAIGIPQSPFCCVFNRVTTRCYRVAVCHSCLLFPIRSKNSVPPRIASRRPCLDKPKNQHIHKSPVSTTEDSSRKEMFQPHLPVRLPCYDLALVAEFTLTSILSPASGPPNSHGLTGGVYKVRERIHRAMADARLLAIPASWGRVADPNPNCDRLCKID